MRSKLGWVFLIGAASALAALWAGFGGALDPWEYATWAWRVRAFADAGPVSDRIRLVLLDQASLDWGKERALAWPWPREVYAPLLDFCERAGARAVGFDVLFTEPSYAGVGDDAALGAAVARSRAFAGAVFLGAETGVAAWPAGVPEPADRPGGLEAWRLAGGAVAGRALFPVPEVATNATCLGNVSDRPDADGIFRRATLFGLFDGRWVPSLGLAPYLASERRAGRPVPLALRPGELRAGRLRAPVDAAGRALLRFRRPGAYPRYRAAAVIESELRLREGGAAPEIDPAGWRDAYVLFGFSAPGLLDLRPTPLSPAAPGVLLHATVLDNVLSDAFLRETPAWAAALSTVLLALACAGAVVAARRAWQSAAWLALFVALPLGAGFAAYAAGWWYAVVPAGLAASLAGLGGLVFSYATEGRQKAFIKQAFRHYLSPAVIDRLLADPARLQLGGERKELTIFFSDLQGFSGFSERMPPAELTGLLNAYLSDMTDIVLGEGGTLDKYEGDAIIAFWNAPVDQPDHAVRAVRAALACQRRLEERRAGFVEQYGAELRMRVGLNTGEVVVGNMGSRERFDYTVLGDAANLASRLEGANKAFGTFLMVSESTWRATAGAFDGRLLGRLRVVGRRAPVAVYEPFGPSVAGGPRAGGPFEQGRERFEAGAFEEAAGLFASCGADPAAAAYLRRCRELLAAPPASWEPVWNLTEK